MFTQRTLVFTSALAESFLRKLVKSNLIRYAEGTDEVTTHDDEPPEAATLKPLDATTRNRLEKVKGTHSRSRRQRLETCVV